MRRNGSPKQSELVDDDITVSTHILFHESSAEGIIAEAERTDSAMIVVGGGGGGASSDRSPWAASSTT